MSSRKRRVILGSAIFVVVMAGGVYYVAAFGWPFRTAAPVSLAEVLEPTRINLLTVCGSDAVVEVDETPTEVRVDLRIREQPGDCAGNGTAELENPLGNRQLIDEYTGQPVVVARP